MRGESRPRFPCGTARLVDLTGRYAEHGAQELGVWQTSDFFMGGLDHAPKSGYRSSSGNMVHAVHFQAFLRRDASPGGVSV